MLILGPFVTARGCTSWCHWSDENCEKDPCVDCPRCQQLSRESKGPPVPPLVQKAAVAPDDPLIEYSGYLHLEVTRERATFERAYISNRIYSRNPGFKENPGARIRWRTDAQRVVVDLDYLEQCDESCPMDANRGCYARRVCYCHCRVRLFRDGDQEELFSRIQSGGKYGPGHFELPVVPYQASPTMHEYMMVLPWCASVAFRGIALESEASAPVPQLMALTPPPPRPRYVAWGDSITHGWCGNESYPARIARLNQWEPFNMGIQGMTMAAEVGHGIAGLKGDLYTLMVGANDCTGNGLGGFGSRMHEMLRTLRAALPHAVLVVLTPVEFGGCRIEPFREALRSGVSGLAAADSGVLLMEGKHLIPRGDFIEDGNPHPTSNGMVEMALNFNAELGFSQTRFQLRGCDPMRLQVMLPPNRDFVVYSGPSVELAHGEATRLRNTASCQPCCWRSFMVSPQSSLRGKTDATGVATVVLKGACDATAWQVMDLATCHTSRLGSAAAFNSTVRTAASALKLHWTPKRVTSHTSSSADRGQPARPPHSTQSVQSPKAEAQAKWWSGRYPAPRPAPPPKPLPLASLKCYAERYIDLLAGFCGGKIHSCNWVGLLEHWEERGIEEQRVFECSAPNPPPAARSPPPLPPPPSSASLTVAHSALPTSGPKQSPPPLPPAAPNHLTSRRQEAFSKVLMPLFGAVVLVYVAYRLGLGCRAAARRDPATPRRSQYSKAATETPDTELDERPPSTRAFSIIDDFD